MTVFKDLLSEVKIALAEKKIQESIDLAMQAEEVKSWVVTELPKIIKETMVGGHVWTSLQGRPYPASLILAECTKYTEDLLVDHAEHRVTLNDVQILEAIGIQGADLAIKMSETPFRPDMKLKISPEEHNVADDDFVKSVPFGFQGTIEYVTPRE